MSSAAGSGRSQTAAPLSFLFTVPHPLNPVPLTVSGTGGKGVGDKYRSISIAQSDSNGAKRFARPINRPINFPI